MWRHDAQHSAASGQKLAGKLHLQWVRTLSPLKPAWPDQPKLQFDAAYEPVVMGKTMFLGSSRNDCVLALDTATGAERWRFYTEGPVRLAPAAWEGRLFVACDDGYLYCLDAGKGTLLWKFRGGPSDRKILGNDRLISTWPARGAPVVADGTVYFAAGIWPFMGIFIHALDARTGTGRWTTDGDGSQYILQPHYAYAFAGVAPQGHLAVQGDTLIIPGGRSVAALYQRHTGKLLHYRLAENGKRGGGHEVAAGGKLLFNGSAAFELAGQKYLGELGKQIVLCDPIIFAYDRGGCRAFDMKTADLRETVTIDRKGQQVTSYRWGMEDLASCKTPPLQDLIKAGTNLYAAAGSSILAIRFNLPEKEGTIIWTATVEGKITRLLAADDRLFAVTLEGKIYCFGADQLQPKEIALKDSDLPSDEVWVDRARSILKATGVREGYCVAMGIGSGRLVTELVRHSNLRIVAVEADTDKVRSWRDRWAAAGLYGERIAIVQGDPATYPLPPYLAGLVVSEDLSGIKLAPVLVKKVLEVLRPYGGVACFHPEAAKSLAEAATALAGARIKESPAWTLLLREGPLPGSANWTHEHADAANTRVSKDTLVKAPLGLLWFGGPSHDGVLPRHGHGPQPQVIDGRLIIEGVDFLRALDIYTGRLLWETPLPAVGAFYNNLFHQPGANSSGTNFISTSDGIYVVYGSACLRLDPATGKKLTEFKLPPLPGKKSARWGYINVAGDYLVGGADPLFDPKAIKPPTGKNKTGDDDDNDRLLGRLFSKVARLQNDNLSSSKHLVVMDRHTGEVKWTVTARDGFRHNGTCVGGGRLYTLDRLSGLQLSRLQRLGQEPEHGPRLLAFDLASGKKLWTAETGVFGTWLSYSEKHDVLVEAGRVARDTITDEPKGMRAYRAGDGKALWFDKSYTGPAMIHGDTVLQGQGGCDLLTGALKMRPDPLTGIEVPWQWTRNYGCNTPAASEHLLTFRSGAAGYYDLCHDGGTGNFGGFRSSCTNNLIVAGGLLTAPDYTRTCTCSYQNQTSLALIHMPDAEMWTFFGTKTIKGPIRRVGINLGAPGDRRADDGTLWLEYPSVAGVSPAVPITITPAKPEWFRRHSSAVHGKLKWVGASGAKGLTSLTITLREKPQPGQAFTVRLHFVEPDGLKPGQRIFSVAMQGKMVLADLDIVQEAGGPNRVLVKEFAGIEAARTLTVRLTPGRCAVPTPVLCGIEVVAEGRDQGQGARGEKK
jgi:outer membrane protein assembly factor BamB